MNASAIQQSPLPQQNQLAHFFWVCHASRCISFHAEAGFLRQDFASSRELWQQLHRLIARGYLVQ